MPMYRIQSEDHHLQRFRSTEFSARYQEQDLEDWLELHPEVLTDDEPILIIGRQVYTGTSGTLDLLGLDADGATVVIELKKSPTPRDIIAQALEYATWVAGLDVERLTQLAREYLAQNRPDLTLEQAWQQTFGGLGGEESTPSLPSDLHWNEHQRIIVVTEGTSDRIASVAQYLRRHEIDISLIEYRYYQADGGQEILDLEQRVGRDTGTQPSSHSTEESVLQSWSADLTNAYVTFRDRVMEDDLLQIEPKPTAISFYKSTRDGRAFICYFGKSTRGAVVSFRLDSLEGRMDIHAAADAIRATVPPDVQINAGSTWFPMHFSVSQDRARDIADLMAEQIISKVE